jgi:hypothetical protein
MHPLKTTKLGFIEFDNRILDALRDDRLVVFAGAGVSMGPQSNLPSYEQLCSEIARGTGVTRDVKEPLDRFLGRLCHRKVDVHQRACEVLSRVVGSPNSLHHDILRLFRTPDRVRLVTTNFDLRFEAAAEAVFGTAPDAYCAPALPLGGDFSGIVHIHGAMPRAQRLVLTDADFGRAYLTEGWARRFLVELFRRYVVLFVGYSHDDPVMTYLARALPADGVVGRFVLTDDDGNWGLLDISPMHFVKHSGAEPFRELYESVNRLADRTTRGVLDWQSRLAELGNRVPPTDEEAISEIEQALRATHTTRFLLKHARGPEWLRWLDERQHLAALHNPAELNERDLLLAGWLAQHFVIEYADEVFEMLARHGLRLNPALWLLIGRELGSETDKPLSTPALRRWATILLDNVPLNRDHHVLLWLAERCSRGGCVDLTVKVFLSMSVHRLAVKPGFVFEDDKATQHRRRLTAACTLVSDHWSLSEVWARNLRPNVAHVAQPLLSGLMHRLEEMHGALAAWGDASRTWDSISYSRTAIEPHEQDRHPDPVDALVDVMRDVIEWIAANSPQLLDTWIERLANSDAPLLRRLAIHAISMHPTLTAEDRLNWLLSRAELHGLAEHHEVHRAVAIGYAAAAEPARKMIVDAVLAHELPATDLSTAEERTARRHFDWLSWLLKARPDCALAAAALSPITAQYPNWQPTDHPDLTHWMGSVDWVATESPWTIEQLLARKPSEQLDELLNFSSSRFDGPSREGLLVNIREASKQSASWALALATALAERTLWTSDLWTALLHGLRDCELPADGWRDILALISNSTLQSAHACEVADLLCALVRNGGKPFALELLGQANGVALDLWRSLGADRVDQETHDWLFCAINRPGGVIVEFWIQGLSLLLHGKSGAERAMPESYRTWLTAVVGDATANGGMGRCLLASQAAFLFGLDESWTRQYLLPQFSDPDQQRFLQAWDGFLAQGRLYPTLAEALMPAFLEALPRYRKVQADRRRRLVELCALIAMFHLPGPPTQLICALFSHGSIEDRVAFASHIGCCLRQMQPSAIQELWRGWLKHYWMDRLHGVLAPVDDGEAPQMLEWLPRLGDAFPDAVTLAVRLPKSQIEQNHIFHDLRESELVTRFPEATAELLTYLADCTVGYHRTDLAAIADRLPSIEPATRTKLDEAFALAGIPLRQG